MKESQPQVNPHQTQFSIYMMGAPNTGKSSLLQRYLDDKCETEVKLEIQTPILKHSMIDGNPIGMNLYDKMIEQGNIDEIGKLKGIFMVVSINSQETLNFLIKNKQLLKDKDFVKVLIGNKSDLKGEREIERSEAIEKATFEFGSQIKYIECSALTGENVQEAFKEMQSKLISQAKEKANQKQESSCCQIF